MPSRRVRRRTLKYGGTAPLTQLQKIKNHFYNNKHIYVPALGTVLTLGTGAYMYGRKTPRILRNDTMSASGSTNVKGHQPAKGQPYDIVIPPGAYNNEPTIKISSPLFTDIASGNTIIKGHQPAKGQPYDIVIPPGEYTDKLPIKISSPLFTDIASGSTNVKGHQPAKGQPYDIVIPPGEYTDKLPIKISSPLFTDIASGNTIIKGRQPAKGQPYNIIPPGAYNDEPTIIIRSRINSKKNKSIAEQRRRKNLRKTKTR